MRLIFVFTVVVLVTTRVRTAPITDVSKETAPHKAQRKPEKNQDLEQQLHDQVAALSKSVSQNRPILKQDDEETNGDEMDYSFNDKTTTMNLDAASQEINEVLKYFLNLKKHPELVKFMIERESEKLLTDLDTKPFDVSEDSTDVQREQDDDEDVVRSFEKPSPQLQQIPKRVEKKGGFNPLQPKFSFEPVDGEENKYELQMNVAESSPKSDEKSAPNSQSMESGENSAPNSQSMESGENSAPSSQSMESGENSAPNSQSMESGEKSAPNSQSMESGEKSAPSSQSMESDENSIPNSQSMESDENSAPDSQYMESGENSAPNSQSMESDENSIPNSQSMESDENSIPNSLPMETDQQNLQGVQSNVITNVISRQQARSYKTTPLENAQQNAKLQQETVSSASSNDDTGLQEDQSDQRYNFFPISDYKPTETNTDIDNQRNWEAPVQSEKSPEPEPRDDSGKESNARGHGFNMPDRESYYYYYDDADTMSLEEKDSPESAGEHDAELAERQDIELKDDRDASKEKESTADKTSTADDRTKQKGGEKVLTSDQPHAISKEMTVGGNDEDDLLLLTGKGQSAYEGPIRRFAM